MALIAPSLLACNFLRLEEACIMINESSADWFHFDVMDGRFVPNISFGLPILEHVKKVATKPLDSNGRSNSNNTGEVDCV